MFQWSVTRRLFPSFYLSLRRSERYKTVRQALVRFLLVPSTSLHIGTVTRWFRVIDTAVAVCPQQTRLQNQRYPQESIVFLLG